jgi:hypothetical protein
MTLIEALKTGRRFRRAGEKEWRDRKEVNVEAITAEDWEVEPNMTTMVSKGSEVTIALPEWARGKQVEIIVREIAPAKAETTPKTHAVSFPEMSRS